MERREFRDLPYQISQHTSVADMKKEMTSSFGMWGIREQIGGLCGLYIGIDIAIGRKQCEFHKSHVSDLVEMLSKYQNL